MEHRRVIHPVPIEMGLRYRSKARRRAAGKIVLSLCAAAALGGVAGAASLVAERGDLSSVMAAAKPLAVPLGLMRARAPRPGDDWSSCNAARAAGTAPIYIGEPGYRHGMDGDSDGVACESYRGGASTRMVRARLHL